MTQSIRVTLFCLLAIALPSTTTRAQTQASSAKRTVTTESDLPRFSYAMTAAPSEFIQADDATFNVFAERVLTDVNSVLDGYDVQDKATLRILLGVKLDVQLLTGKNESTLVTLHSWRDLQDKPGTRATAGMIAASVLQARIETHSSSGPAYLQAFAKDFSIEVNNLPWTVVQDGVKGMKGTYGLEVSRVVISGLKANVDPAALTTKSVDFPTAAGIINGRVVLAILAPLKEQIVAVLTPYIAAHSVQKPDIWAAREVTLTEDQKLAPVRIAVWDSGLDASLFPRQLFTDESPGPHGAHGLAYDVHGQSYKADLQPLTDEQREVYPTLIGLLQGLNDIQSNIDSAAADETRKTLNSAPPDRLAFLQKQLIFFGQWMHGTHVAGIAVRGNPAARLVNIQFYDSLPQITFAPTVEWANQFKADFLEVGNYLRTNNVRVVNMSWGDDQEEFERWLAKTSTEKDPAVRKELAAKIYAIWREAVRGAIQAAPNTLFVCAAGNSDSDAGFSGDVPASLHLPNLLTVGAVDQAGDETSFTSYGNTVVVDADGFQVESYVPGGSRLKESGTSMASPNVVNLAAKLIALKPALTPEETIALIRQGADRSSDGKLHLINPKATVALLQKN